jgi:hypothetical protein
MQINCCNIIWWCTYSRAGRYLILECSYLI